MMTTANPRLERLLSAFSLTLYGPGNIPGAGIYLLVGKVAASAEPFWIVRAGRGARGGIFLLGGLAGLTVTGRNREVKKSGILHYAALLDRMLN